MPASTQTISSSSAASGGCGYTAVLRASARANWRIEDLLSAELELDFAEAFLPEGLARTGELAFLDAREKLLLNQIRAHGYLATFRIAEEFILPFVLDHARPTLSESDARTRALLGFAGEEAKHIELFKRFGQEFERGFGSECDVIGPPEAVAAEVLSAPPLSVALTILHIEWMTQRHYLESTACDTAMDARMKELLRAHWIEEAQHARLDTLMVHELAASMSSEEIAIGVQGYLEIGTFLDTALALQAGFDVESLERASGSVLSAVDRDELERQQHQALRWTFLGSGMTHPRFLESLERLDPRHRTAIEEVAPTFA